MKKLILFIAIISISLTTALLTQSCKKENINNEIQQYKAFNDKQVEDIDVSRFFDTLYLEQLIAETGIDPVELSRNENFIKYNSGLDGLFLCLSELIFSTELSDIPKRNHVYQLLDQAYSYFDNNDIASGLQVMEDIYLYLDCGIDEVFIYEDIEFNIPYMQIESNIQTSQLIFNSILEDFPRLNEINETQKDDLLIFASIFIQNNKAANPGDNCREIWRVRIKEIRNSWENCLDSVNFNVILGTFCNMIATQRTSQAAKTYEKCVAAGGTP